MSRFNIAKYSIYILVMINLLYYAYLDIEGLELLPPDASVGQIAGGLATTIDYVAWMILIVLFEIETAIIGPRGLTAAGKRRVYAIGLVCYSALVYATYTYIADYYWYDGFETRSSLGICELAGGDHYFLNEKETYVYLTAANCASLEKGQVLIHGAENTLITPEALAADRRLGVVSAANGVAWLLVLLLTQVEIIGDKRRRSKARRPIPLIAVKAALYVILFANAYYWAIFGRQIDAWDACLWLIAFAMIELNLFRLGGESTSPSG